MKTLFRSLALALGASVLSLGSGGFAFANSSATFSTQPVVATGGGALLATTLPHVHVSPLAMPCKDWCDVIIATVMLATEGSSSSSSSSGSSSSSSSESSSSSSSSSGSVHFKPPTAQETLIAQRNYVSSANASFDQ